MTAPVADSRDLQAHSLSLTRQPGGPCPGDAAVDLGCGGAGGGLRQPAGGGAQGVGIEQRRPLGMALRHRVRAARREGTALLWQVLGVAGVRAVAEVSGHVGVRPGDHLGLG